MSAPVPARPRLAEHALVRRHLVDGAEIVVIHDARSGNLVRMGTREWELVADADGTRDFDAIVLAAARRGAYRRASEVRAVLDHLHALGLLADGIAHAPPLEPVDLARPLDVLPRFSLTCDGSGACCAMYGSVLFTPLEAARARALRPDVLDAGDREERAFTPERGSLRVAPDDRLAVALVDGACSYLGADGRCSLHACAGEASKPRGCRVYPATFVDDGESLRVSVGVECACILASVGREGGAPLVDPAARTRGDLGPMPASAVAVLPASIAVSLAGAAPRADFVRWSRRVAALAPSEDGAESVDVVGLYWSLAEAVEASGLDEEAVARAFAAPRAPDPIALAPWIDALVARSEARVAAADAWRAARDRSRLASAWIAAAARSLRDPHTLASALACARFRRDEVFHLRAVLHGHQLVGELPVARALRDRAVRVLLSRALPPALPDAEPTRAHPLALVEALMRGHGLAAYAAAVA